MTLITYFSPIPKPEELPGLFNSPFNHTPHPLAVIASEHLQKNLASDTSIQHEFNAQDGGKMFGVLVVKDHQNRIGYLSAFSGMLEKKWLHSGFVPPVFNQETINAFLPDGEQQLLKYSQKIEQRLEDPIYCALKQQFIMLKLQREEELSLILQKHKLRKNHRKIQRAAVNLPEKTRLSLIYKLSFDSQEDKREKKAILKRWENRLEGVEISIREFNNQINRLKLSRTKFSKFLHEKIFSNYQLRNASGQQKSIAEFFHQTQPPGGTGDCAAPKLLQYANQQQLTPLAIGEFWWGASPASEIRHHKHYYPSCRGKCYPILPFMLEGLDVQAWQDPGSHYANPQMPEVLYEDDALLVINKPIGLLSIPGKNIQDSVLSRIQKKYPNFTGPLLVHRLDLDTSGLLLVAKNAAIHKALQQQFIQRNIKKQYVALLSNPMSGKHEINGCIELPLRVDLEDRPRQIVCAIHGKNAITHWKFINQDSNNIRINLYPVTGRTHQLRVHMAHVCGLNNPIKGDKLYGIPSDRLYLHAEKLTFIHPTSGKKMHVKSAAPF